MAKFKKIVNQLILFLLFFTTIGIVYNAVIQTNNQKDHQPAFNFQLNDLEGNIHHLTDYEGKGVVVNFWATYCPPCKKEMPYLDAAYQEYKNQGVEVLAINVGEPLLYVNSFLSKNQVSFPVLLDRGEKISKSYGIINLPMTLFIDEDGNIVEKISGEMTEQVIRENMEKIKTES